MKKLLITLGLVAGFSASAQVPIVIAQDPSARVTIVGIDSKTPYLIDTGNPNIKRVWQGVQFTKLWSKDQMVIAQIEFSCSEGLERSLWARDGDTNELLASTQPWTRIKGSSLKIYDMVCIQGSSR